LLSQPFAKDVLSSTQDDSLLKSLLNFIMETGSFERLIGCYVLKTANGDVLKVEGAAKKNAPVYVVDEEGFHLFEKVGERIIKPTTLGPNVIREWNSTDFNVRQLNGAAIDEFLHKRMSPAKEKTVSELDKAWLTDVWKYIFSREFSVTFYKNLPTLALSSDDYTFVSIEGFNTLPIMPSHVSPQLRGVCTKLGGIHVLKNTKLDAVIAVTSKWECEEHFLKCLERLGVNNLSQTMVKKLNNDELMVIRDLISYLSFSEEFISIFALAPGV